MIKILKENHNTIIIFITPLILFLIGFSIYKDYGISSDEWITRNNGLISIKYIVDLFFSQYASNFELIQNIPELKNYSDKQYGTFFEILVTSIVEILFQVKDFSEIYYYRHLANHCLFITALICFYFLCQNLFKNRIYALFATSILYTTPRIFAESFYNSKDLAFLSFFVFLVYFSIKLIKKTNYYNAFLLSIFAALAINSRIVAFYVGILLILFFSVEFLMKNKFDTKKIKILIFFLFFKFAFLYLTWPFLWENPIENFIYTLSTFSRFVLWGGYVFYLGEFHNVYYLPSHYLVVSFFATTPILISLLIVCGLLQLLFRFFKRLINIDYKNSYKDIWRSEKEKIFLFLFFIIFIPIFLIFIFDSVVYNSWRHLFFIYPPLILLLIYFIDIIAMKFRNKKIIKYINVILVIILLNNIYSLISLHPFQYVYFNSIFEKNANKLFEIDYWGVSNKSSLEKLMESNLKKSKIVVGVASFTNLYLSRQMLDAKLQDKLVIAGQDFRDADFIFNNNYFEINNRYDDKYQIPKNFKKYSELKRGSILINEFYVKE